MKKSFIALTIIIFLMLSTCTAYSLDFTDIKDTKYENAVSFLSAYNIASGYPDNTFKSGGYVTRAEVSKLLTIVLGYENYSENMISSFSDMDNHWAEQYVDIMNALDIVQGYLNSSFGPDDYVTYSESITMIVRALGYTDRSLIGDWPYDYFVKAAELGIVKDVKLSSGYATRGDIALMLYNVVNCKIVKINDNNEIEKTENTLLDNIGSKEIDTITLDYLEKPSKINIEEYLFHNAVIYYNLNNEIVYIEKINTKQFDGKVTTQLTNNKIFVTDKNGNIKVFDFTGVPVYFNGAKGKVSSLLNTFVSVIYDEDDENKSANGIKVTKVTDVLDVNKKDIYVEGSTKFMDKYLPLNKDKTPVYDNIFITGDAEKLKDIKEKDVLYFYETDEYNFRKTKLTIEVVRNKIIGKISKISNGRNEIKYEINGQYYSLSPNFNETEIIKLGYEVEALLDKDNKIIRFYITKYFNDPKTYGLVIGTKDGKKTNGSRKETILPQVKIIDQFGNKKIYEIEEDSDILSLNNSAFNPVIFANLKTNDMIKFDVEDNGKIKLIKKIETYDFSEAYDSVSGTIKNENNVITDETIIFYKDESVYEIITREELGDFISGIIIKPNNKKEISVMYLEKGIRNIYSGYYYDIIKDVTQLLDIDDNVIEEPEFYISNPSYKPVYTSTKMTKSLENYKNKFVKLSMKDGKIADIEEVIAENEITQVQAVYSRLLKIDGTYYEISTDINIYVCTTDENNIINGVIKGTKEDINIGSRVQFYDTTGEYEGIIDVIIVYE